MSYYFLNLISSSSALPDAKISSIKLLFSSSFKSFLISTSCSVFITSLWVWLQLPYYIIWGHFILFAKNLQILKSVPPKKFEFCFNAVLDIIYFKLSVVMFRITYSSISLFILISSSVGSTFILSMPYLCFPFDSTPLFSILSSIYCFLIVLSMIMSSCTLTKYST